ncbi:MAG: styrene monooxygenase/indole monooxygenase family protein [Pseudonocardiaceae bacterium]
MIEMARRGDGTMVNIGIVGAGISGLHLALRLQQLGVDTTLYAEKGPEEWGTSRLLNLVVRFEQTCSRERTLNVNSWDFPDLRLFCTRITRHDEPGESLCGALSQPASAVDFRLYLPRLVEEYQRRGGRVILRPVDAQGVTSLSGAHDLMVVAVGGHSMANLFERDPGRSPYTAPQRQLCVGLFLGMAYPEPLGVDIHLIPGVGEIFHFPFHSLAGRITGINFEAVPGGPMEMLAHLSYEADPPGFERSVLDLLARYAPRTREQVDDRSFSLARPIDLLQGAITPVVRRSWAALGEDRYVIAMGDAWVLNDPILGQGGNLGSNCAFALAEAIVNAKRFDENFCHSVEERMWGIARPVTEWSNISLQPLPPHVRQLLTSASADQRVADALVDKWNDPVSGWATFGSPAGTATFLRCFG